MSKRNKILLILIVAFGLLAGISSNEMVRTIALVGTVLFVIIMEILDFIVYYRLINQIKNSNEEYIVVKEKYKWVVFFTGTIIIFNMVIIIKKRIEMYKMEGNTIDIVNFIDSLGGYETCIIIISIAIIILAIFTMIKALIASSLLTKDKIVFYDGLVFEVDKIEAIKYSDSKIFKNKKIISVGKGFIDRQIMINLDDFSKAKSILDETEFH